MKTLRKEQVHYLNGEGGLVERIIHLTEMGVEVCKDNTFKCGTALYMLAYYEEEYSLEVEEDHPFPHDKPDWSHVKSFLETYPTASLAKTALVDYASKFGIEKSFFNKTASFEKLLQKFQGKWGSLQKGQSQVEDS
tara:strand:+ start:782 stop:1189 length:408 start_codon:yes stop_codon:yes gene_type:complete